LSTGLYVPGIEAVRDRIAEHIRVLENARRRLEEVDNIGGASLALELQIPLRALLNDIDGLLDAARNGGYIIASSQACKILDKAYSLVRSIDEGAYGPFGPPLRVTLLTLISLLSDCSRMGG